MTIVRFDAMEARVIPIKFVVQTKSKGRAVYANQIQVTAEFHAVAVETLVFSEMFVVPRIIRAKK